MANVDAQIGFIRERLHESRTAQTAWLKRTRWRALILQTGTVALSGGVSVLLALRGIDVRLETLFVNLALVAGVGITIFQAWAAFFNDRAMWISRALFLHQLGLLEARFDYVVAKNATDVDPRVLDQIMGQLMRIHAEESRRWREIRGWAVGVGNQASPSDLHAASAADEPDLSGNLIAGPQHTNPADGNAVTTVSPAGRAEVPEPSAA